MKKIIKKIPGKNNKEKMSKAILFTYILLVTLMMVSFVTFTLVLRPLMSHPDVTENIATMLYIFMIILTVLAGISGILVLTLLERRK